jgi:hypothetical protein
LYPAPCTLYHEPNPTPRIPKPNTYALTYELRALNIRRCDCPKDEESLKQCFILEFDRVVYTKWDDMNEAQMRQFYNERVVYHDKASSGLRV